MNLLELVSCYGTIVNDGQPKQPVLVTRIYRTNKNGEKEEIYNSKVLDDPSRALSHTQAYSVRRMLEAVCSDAGGTGLAINNYVSNVGIGGKTGTSNNYTDAWFVAITPRLVCGAWVGGQYRQIHFRSANGQGSRAALPLVGLFLQKVLSNSAFRYLHKEFPVDYELDRYIMACSNSAGGEENTNAYQPYNDSITPQNSADGSYDSTFYIRNKVRDDLGTGRKPDEEDEVPNIDKPAEDNEFFN